MRFRMDLHCRRLRKASRHLDAAIEHVHLYDAARRDDPAWRMRAAKCNRAYRVYLRAQLIQEDRTPERRRFDEVEAHQVEPFSPKRGLKGGVVQSPMSAAQLGLASDAAVLNALARRDGGWSRFSENELPIGDGEQVLGELQKLTETAPAKVMRIAWKAAKTGQLDDARALADVLGKHGDPAETQRLAIALFGDPGTPLATDDRCAASLEAVARRDGLSPETIAAIVARMESAGAMSDFAESDMDEQSLAVFGAGGGLVMIPPGAYHWVCAVYADLSHRRVPEPTRWQRTIRAALQADPNPATWLSIVNGCGPNWGWLAKEYAYPLLREIEEAVHGGDMDYGLVRAYLPLRGHVPPDAIALLVSRMAARGAQVYAAELVALVASDGDQPWAGLKLDAWIQLAEAPRFARGVVACVGSLLAETGRRALLAEIATKWIPLASSSDLSLMFIGPRDTWRADADGVRVMQALVARIPDMEIDALGSTIAVLEGFVEGHPDLTLAAVEAGMTRVLSMGDQGTQPIVADILALTFSLRLRAPALRTRVHEVFGRALQADSFAATEALDAADGRPGPSFLFRPYQRVRQPRPMRRRRQRSSRLSDPT